MGHAGFISSTVWAQQKLNQRSAVEVSTWQLHMSAEPRNASVAMSAFETLRSPMGELYDLCLALGIWVLSS